LLFGLEILTFGRFNSCHSALDADSVYSFLHLINIATPIPSFSRGKKFTPFFKFEFIFIIP
jgi:hypothetical protein